MSSTINLLAVGDIILSAENPSATFKRTSSLIQEADIAFFNCETPYAESGSPGLAPHGALPHNPRNLPAIKEAGFDICTLSNNHSMDWGVDALVECRERLEALGIAVCGAGRDMAEARSPAIVERKGTKFAFVGYCSVGPNASIAEHNKPGIAMVRARTIYEPLDYQPGSPATRVLTYPYDDDVKNMIEDIRLARQVADVVVATYHWGIHAVPAAIPDYEFEVGRAAIDAGADLVLGHSTHILKGIEVYKGKVIIHSLADFNIDLDVEGLRRPDEVVQDRSLPLSSYHDMMHQAYPWQIPDQTKSMIVNCQIVENEIRRVSYRPVMLDDSWSNPEPLDSADPRSIEIKNYMDTITKEVGLGTHYEWDGDDVVVDLGVES